MTPKDLPAYLCFRTKRVLILVNYLYNSGIGQTFYYVHREWALRTLFSIEVIVSDSLTSPNADIETLALIELRRFPSEGSRLLVVSHDSGEVRHFLFYQFERYICKQITL